MLADLSISKLVEINATASAVWDVLVNPEKITQYFTGAETITDWQTESEIIFIHYYNGQQVRNKGSILQFNINHLLQYTYWTSFSKTEDAPENYTTITYTLLQADDKTQLLLTQTNFKNKEWYEGLQQGWDTVLQKMKAIAEA